MPSSSSGFRAGSGRLCLDFIRTLRHRGTGAETEELPDPMALAAWTSRFGPWESVPADAAAGRDGEARELREAVHALIAAARGPEGIGPPVDASRERVNRVAALPPPAPALDGSGHLAWHADDPVRAVLALIARDAVDLVGGPALDRVRECAGSDCRALFLDTSRPGTRRWCSMNTCGNKAKKQGLRERVEHRP
ncbi:CGNR zinc finger domain-containing protein [Actinomadura terrae]|uniref:CGNR zinc finger domain-containing protein n=1 Tax=Actinomadura terrae TaxID=604353 RepID=UPI001FA74EDD|nr:CGNR zinc finger domain-containing protein [Actinomadura terrae]